MRDVSESVPIEILQYIFKLHAVEEPPLPPLFLQKPRVGAHQGGALGFIRLGHVCSRWRASLLQTHEVWANSVGTLPRGIHEMARRAGNLRLDFHIRGAYGMDELSQIWPRLRHHSSRVRSLVYRETRFQCASAELGILKRISLPCLEFLRIETNDNVLEWGGERAVVQLELPKLKHLTLSNANVVGLGSHNLENITIVTRDMLAFPRGARSVTTRPIDVCCFNALTVRSIVLRANVTLAIRDGTRRLFPALRYLRYEDETDNCDSIVNMLRCMNYPADTRVHLIFHPVNDTPETSRLTNLIAALLEAGSAPPSGLRISHRDGHAGQSHYALRFAFYNRSLAWGVPIDTEKARRGVREDALRRSNDRRASMVIELKFGYGVCLWDALDSILKDGSPVLDETRVLIMEGFNEAQRDSFGSLFRRLITPPYFYDNLCVPSPGIGA